MGHLIYSMMVSLDGYVADQQRDFMWAVPDEEVLATVNEQTATVGTYLYGRRMYELMHVWETDPDIAGDSPGSQKYATLWQQATKIVYSQRLDEVATQRTTLRRHFDPAEIRQLKETSTTNLTVDGPTLAAEAFRYDLVDEIHPIVCPIVVGAGLAFLPKVGLDLELLTSQRFANGMVSLQYQVNHCTKQRP